MYVFNIYFQLWKQVTTIFLYFTKKKYLKPNEKAFFVNKKAPFVLKILKFLNFSLPIRIRFWLLLNLWEKLLGNKS